MACVNPPFPIIRANNGKNKKIRTAIKNGGTHIFFAARKEFSSSLGKFNSFLDCKKKEESFRKARNIVLRLLKFRLRSEQELRDKLTIRKGYSRELYSFTKNLNSQSSKESIKKIYSSGYMNLAEIKSYAKKVGKW